jgi:hypothetical protein
MMMKNNNTIKIVFIFLIFLSGCLTSQQAEPLKLYIFMDKRCPNCQVAEPFIGYLIEKYDIGGTTFLLWTDKEDHLALFKYYNITAVPTALLFYEDGVKKYIGRTVMPELEVDIARIKGMPLPERPADIQLTYDIGTCKECHQEPPTTYSCSSCCHGV